MISKDILSLVLGLNNDDVTLCEVKDDVIHLYDSDVHCFYKLNLDTLTRKMKEWCLTKDYWVDSNLQFVSIGLSGQAKPSKSFNGYDLKLDERELVEKATEWVYNEKK